MRARHVAGLALVTGAALLCAACSGGGDDDDDADDAGDPPGAACETGEVCPSEAVRCFGVGSSSSCAQRGLCVGAAGALTCAAPCTADDECLTTEHCLVGCATSMFNGYCVDLDTEADLISYPFCETASRSVGFAGASY